MPTLVKRIPPLSVRHEYALVALILLAACACRMVGLGRRSLWVDEVFTIRSTHLSWFELWFTSFDVHPPLYNSVIKALLSNLPSEFELRFPSVIFGLLWIFVAWRFARRLGGTTVGLVTALLLSFNLRHIEYSQEGRSYALLGFLISGLMLQTIVILGQEARLRWTTCALWSLTSILILYTHIIGLFYWGMSSLFVLYWLVFAGSLRYSDLGRFVLANIVAFLVWCWWLRLTFLHGDGSAAFTWLSQAGVAEAIGTYFHLFDHQYIGELRWIADAIVVILFVVAGIKLWKRGLVGRYILAMALLVPLGIWLIGFYKPIYLVRTILASLTAILTAIALVAERGRWRIVMVTLLAGNVLVSLKEYSSFVEISSQRENWRQTQITLAKAIDQGETVVFCSSNDARPYAYYDLRFRMHSIMMGSSYIFYYNQAQSSSPGFTGASAFRLVPPWEPDNARPFERITKGPIRDLSGIDPRRVSIVAMRCDAGFEELLSALDWPVLPWVKRKDTPLPVFHVDPEWQSAITAAQPSG